MQKKLGALAKQRRLIKITLQGVIEKSSILLSQYWKIYNLKEPQPFHILGVSIIFSTTNIHPSISPISPRVTPDKSKR